MLLLLRWRCTIDDDGGMIKRNYRHTEAIVVAVTVVYIRLGMLYVHNMINIKNKKKINED